MTLAIAVVFVLVIMAGELVRSRANERTLRQQGASEPQDDVYRAMAWAYPLMFAAMGAEGLWRNRPSPTIAAAGFVVFVTAKALKYWAIATLGSRWTYRVLVPRNATLNRTGPYAFVRHPNYIAVFGEILGFAMFAGALVTGPASLLIFGALVRQRILVEERALGISGRYT